MTSKSTSIYFLTSAESKVRAYCDTCGHEVDGIACIRIESQKITSIVVRCHGAIFGVKVTDELLNGGRIGGFILDRDNKLKPVDRQSRIEPIISTYTMKLEEAIRLAKEKIYTKIYRGGQMIDSSKFGLVRGAMINPQEEKTEYKEEEDDYNETGKGRRIILEE